jgi:hypothetical protein
MVLREQMEGFVSACKLGVDPSHLVSCLRNSYILGLAVCQWVVDKQTRRRSVLPCPLCILYQQTY